MTIEIISRSFSTKVWDRARIKLPTPESAVRHASVARPRGPVSHNVVCGASKASDQPAHMQSDHSLCYLLEYSMSVKLLTEH